MTVSTEAPLSGQAGF